MKVACTVWSGGKSRDHINRITYHYNRLNEFKDEYYVFKKEFMQTDFSSWIQSEEYAELFEDVVFDTKYFERQIQYNFLVMDISPHQCTLLDNNNSCIKSLSDEVFDEIADSAKSVLARINDGGRVTQKTINNIRESAAKLKSLAFISDEVQGLSDYVNAAVSRLPLTGMPEGNDRNDFLLLLTNLSSPSSARKFGRLIDDSAHKSTSGSVSDFFIEEEEPSDDSNDPSDDSVVADASFDQQDLQDVPHSETAGGESLLNDEDKDAGIDEDEELFAFI